MEDNGTEPVGPRLPAPHLRAQPFVDFGGVRWKRRRCVSGDQRFFLCASARSILRGCTVTPNCDCTTWASARACIGSPSR